MHSSLSDRGDFLATFGRNLPGDQNLANTFRKHFLRTEDTEESFSLENFLLENMDSELSNLSVIAEHMNLLRSDHSQFWVVNNKEYFASLPAIMLSDLGEWGIIYVLLQSSFPGVIYCYITFTVAGPYRGYMRQCYHSQCDTLSDNQVNWSFFGRTVQALIGECAGARLL